MNKTTLLKILAKREEYLKMKLKEENEDDLSRSSTKEAIQQSLSEIALISMIIYCIWEDEK